MERLDRKKQKERTPVSVMDMLAVLYIAHKLIPAAGQFMPSVVYLAVFAGIAVLLATAKHNVMTGSRFFFLVFAFAISVTSLVYTAVTANLATFTTNAYGELQTFLYGWLAIWYIERTSPKKVKRIFMVIVAFYALTALTTYIGCTMYPGASRLLATFVSTDAEYILYTSRNIGGFTFVYELILGFPLLIYFIKTKRLKTVPSVIILVALGLIILKTEYTTALVLFFVSLVLLAVKHLNAKKIVTILVIALVLLLIFGGLIADLVEWVGEIVPSATLTSRFNYIAATLRGEKVEDTTGSGDRLSLYQSSIDVIRDTKLMGNWTGDDTSGHSLILDTLAKYGFIGIIAIVLMYVSIYRLVLYPNRNKDYFPYLVWIFVVAIFLAVINPKTNIFIFICVIPLFTAVIDNEKGEEGSEIALDSK